MNGGVSPLAGFWVQFRENWLAVGALAVVVLILLVALIAPIIAPQDPYDLATLSLLDARRPPGHIGSGGYVHLLGTDDQGRGIEVRTVHPLLCGIDETVNILPDHPHEGEVSFMLTQLPEDDFPRIRGDGPTPFVIAHSWSGGPPRSPSLVTADRPATGREWRPMRGS